MSLRLLCSLFVALVAASASGCLEHEGDRQATPATNTDPVAQQVRVQQPSRPRRELLPSEPEEPPRLTAEELEAEPERPGHDWPWFLGPTHDGKSQETGLLKTWPRGGPPRLWDKPIGEGYSAPSVRGDKLVVHYRQGNEEIIECMHAASGRTLWTHATPSSYRDPYGYNNGPRCTPILTEDRCHTLGAEGRLVCVDLADGTPVWERNLRDQFEIPEAFFGVGSTPLMEAGKLIVAVGGQPNSGVVAFDPESGDILWENVGRSTWDGAETGDPREPVYEWTGEEMVVSYSSPIAVTIHGQRHLLCLMRQGLVSLDPDTGEERFHHWFRSRVHESVNAARPVVLDDRILLGAAYRMGSEFLQVAPDGKSVDVLWTDGQVLATHWTTSINANGAFFGFSGRHENEATLQCVEVESGRVIWETFGVADPQSIVVSGLGARDRDTRRPIPWPFYGRGSAILAENRLIVLAERGGMMALLEANPEKWVEISRCEIEGLSYPCWAAPVLSRGRLYLRSEDLLVCLDLMEKPER